MVMVIMMVMMIINDDGHGVDSDGDCGGDDTVVIR